MCKMLFLIVISTNLYVYSATGELLKTQSKENEKIFHSRMVGQPIAWKTVMFNKSVIITTIQMVGYEKKEMNTIPRLLDIQL